MRQTYVCHTPIAGRCACVFLAEQIGTSVKMIESHFGHVNTIKHADRYL